MITAPPSPQSNLLGYSIFSRLVAGIPTSRAGVAADLEDATHRRDDAQSNLIGYFVLGKNTRLHEARARNRRPRA
jgi:hypothetical protein